MVISDDPTLNLIIRIVIVVVCAPIIAIGLLGTGLALIYSALATSTFITVFLLATRNKKNPSHNHNEITNQFCTKCGEMIPTGNAFCIKCGLRVGNHNE